MSNAIAPGSSADVNVQVRALGTDPNVSVTYKTVILKKNIVNGVNTLTQSMMSDENTKYVVKYDYVLGSDITIPANCILEFDGGSVSGNGENKDTITGNFLIDSEAYYIFKNVNVDAAANNRHINIKWFGAVGDDINDDTSAILKAIYGKSEISVFFPNGTYRIISSIDPGLYDQKWYGDNHAGSFNMSSTMKKETVIHCTNATGDPITYVHAQILMQNITIRGNNANNTTGMIIGTPYTFEGEHNISNVCVVGFERGIHIESVFRVTIKNCRIHDNQIGIYNMQRYRNDGTDHGYVTVVGFDSCEIQGNAKYAYYKDYYSQNEIINSNAATINFTNCVIENNGKGYSSKQIEPTNTEISCKTFDGINTTSVGTLIFTECYGEGVNYGGTAESAGTFIDVYRGDIYFNNSRFWTNRIKILFGHLTIISSEFKFLTLKSSDCTSGPVGFTNIYISNDSIVYAIDHDISYWESTNYLSLSRTRTSTKKIQSINNDTSCDGYYMGDVVAIEGGDHQRKLAAPFGWGKSGAIGRVDWFDALGDRLKDKKFGTTSERPTPADINDSPLRIGFQYFDTNLNLPVIWNGTKWVNFIDNNVFVVFCSTNSPYDYKLIRVSDITGNEAGTFAGAAIIENGRVIIVSKNAITSGRWSTTNTLVGTAETFSSIAGDFNGKQKTAAIIQALGDNAPIAKTANEYSVTGTPLVAGQWWLPSMGELLMIYSHINAINGVMLAIGGDIIGNIPSSSERGSSTYWAMLPTQGIGYYTKDSGLNVRPVTTLV